MANSGGTFLIEVYIADGASGNNCEDYSYTLELSQPPYDNTPNCSDFSPGANLGRCDLSGRDLSGLDLSGTSFGGANLSGADLSGADLSDAILYETNLSGADLQNTNLTNANLYDADLSGASLSGADLSNARLISTNLCNVTGWTDLSGRTGIIFSLGTICPNCQSFSSGSGNCE